MILLRQTALLFGLWLTVIALWIGVGPHESSGDKADAAIVLGAAVIGDTPTPVFAARIDHAITLYRGGRIKKILFTGGRSSEDELSESATARDYALKAGVPSEAILLEQKSRTT
ncbi:MAG: YdcF family protein, partial [Pseudomonadota bacterium]